MELFFWLGINFGAVLCFSLRSDQIARFAIGSNASEIYSARKKNGTFVSTPCNTGTSGACLVPPAPRMSCLLRHVADEANAQEKESLQNLQHLIHLTCESLGLWKVICDHQFHIVASSLTKVSQSLRVTGLLFDCNMNLCWVVKSLQVVFSS